MPASKHKAEWYVVVSCTGSVEDTRAAAAEALEYAAEQIRRNGYGGALYVLEDDTIDLDVMLATDEPGPWQLAIDADADADEDLEDTDTDEDLVN